MSADSHWWRAVVVVAAVFVVQDAVLAGVRIDGVRPDLLLGVGITAALVGGPERGAVVAFASAITGDLFVNTPFGLSALVACIVAFIAGTIGEALGPDQTWSVPVLTLAASGLAVVTWAVVATVLGLPGLINPRLVLVASVVAVVNAATSWPMTRALRWAFSIEAARSPASAPRGFTP